MTLAVPARLRPSRQQVAPGRWRLVGLLSGVVLAVSSWFCAAVPREYPTLWPGIEPWRSVGGSPLAASLVFAAVGVSVYAWWALRDAPVTAGWHRVTAALWFAPLLASAPLFSRDVYSYAVQGLMLHEGLDPYTQDLSALPSPWAASAPATTTPAPYGPLFLQTARLLVAASSGHLLAAVLLLRLLAVAGVVVLAWALPVLADLVGVDPARPTWLGVLCPLLGLHLVSGAHNDALLVGGLLAGVALVLRGHPGWGLLAVSVAASVKAPVLVAVPFLALLWAADRAGRPQPSRVRLAVLAAVAVLATGAAVIVVGALLGRGFSWLPALVAPGVSVQWTSAPTAWGMLAGAAGQVVGADVTDLAIRVFRLLGLVLLALVLVRLWLVAAAHCRERRVVVLCAGYAVVGVLVLAPSFRAWYLLWALPLLAAATRDRRPLTAYAAVASVLAFAVLPGGYSLALTTTPVGVPLMAAASGLLLARTLRWTRRDPGRIRRVAG